MNLNTIVEVKRPASTDEIGSWKDGYAWLAGGTWLFSEPQVAVGSWPTPGTEGRCASASPAPAQPDLPTGCDSQAR